MRAKLCALDSVQGRPEQCQGEAGESCEYLGEEHSRRGERRRTEPVIGMSSAHLKSKEADGAGGLWQEPP